MPRPRVQPSLIKAATLPAPVGGLNTSAGSPPPTDCTVLWNMAASEYGLRTRLGWREWCTGLDGEVRTLMPFTGSTKDGQKDRLFACTSTGIYDVTASGALTVANRKVTFPTQNADSGWGVSTVMVTNAQGHLLCYADEANGYYIYTEAASSFGPADTWIKVDATQVTGVDPAKFAWVMAWKNMLWFVERDSANAWYLPVGAAVGAATKFQFGNKFKTGGDLRGLWCWTMGGADVDDALVALSGGGDVLAYKGSDPSQSGGFFQSGSWTFPGAFPAGRRLCTDVGGDLLIITMFGLIPLSRVSGGTPLASTQYDTAKIGNLFNQLGGSSRALRGWCARLHPADNSLVTLIPQAAGAPSQQLVMSTLNKSWSRYRDMPIGVAAEAWRGTLYFGTEDGRVCANDGYLDGVDRLGQGGTAIKFALVTAFSDLERPTQKRVQLIRPTILTLGAAPEYQAEARYGWDMTEAGFPAQFPGAGGSLWDAANWDPDAAGGVWQSDVYEPTRRLFGAQGVGSQVAIALSGKAASRMTLTGFEAVYTEGGML